jgi:hypothetical protein
MKRAIFVLCIFLISGCWKKQSHEITAPKTPAYALDGLILDISTDEPLADIVVDIHAVTLVYDVKFEGARDTTLSDGTFHFDKITPGQYTVAYLRNSLIVVNQDVVMEHKDKQCQVSLPVPLIARNYYGPPDWPALNGVCTREAGVVAGIGQWNMIWTSNLVDDFEMVGKINYANKNPEMSALTFSGRFWCTGSGDMSNMIYSIDPARGDIDGQTATPYVLRDISSTRSNLYATTNLGKLIQFGNHPSIVVAELNIPVIQPYGLACDGADFWISDFQTNFIYRIDSALKIEQVVRPFNYWEGKGVEPVDGILYLTYDPSGFLYASDGNYIYKYKIESAK